MIRVKNGQVTLVLANQQLALGIALLMMLMWLFAVVTSVASNAAFPRVVSAVDEQLEPVIVVDSPLLADSTAAAEILETAAPVGEPAVMAGVESVSATYFLEAQKGSVYLQVATMNSDLAGVYAEYLTGRSIPAFTASGADGEKSMLMVGPVRDTVHLAALQGKLRNAGFEL